MATLNQSSIQAGLTQHQAGNLAQAAEIYASISVDSTDYPQAVYLRGILAQDLGDHKKARVLLEQALELNPKQASLCFQLAVSLNEIQETAQAITQYKKALELNPRYVEALCNLGNLLKRTGETTEAIDCYRQALSVAPHVALIHYNLGVLYQEQFKPEAAIDCFRQAVRLKPNYAAAYNNLGVVLSESGQIGDAMACYKKAQRIDPKFADAFYNLHALLLNSEDLTPAIRCLEQAANIAPTNAHYRFFLGLLHDCNADPLSAKPYFSQPCDEPLFKADIDAWNYLKTLNKGTFVIKGVAQHTFRYALERAQLEGLVLEFGVFNGKSIRQIAKLVDGPVHGFDSFEGIPENWNDETLGSYSTKGVLPEVPANVTLHQGWFENSIPIFKQTHTAPIRFMNIDCDLYSSTKTVLDLLAQQITKGTVLVFDEYIGNTSWREDEHKAFHEAAQTYGWSYEVLCFSFVTKQVAFKIK